MAKDKLSPRLAKMAQERNSRQSMLRKIKIGEPSKKSNPARLAELKAQVGDTGSSHHEVVQRDTELNGGVSAERMAQEIKEIRVLMQQAPYSEMLVKALSPRGTTDDIYQVLVHDEVFDKYACYHKPEIARRYAAELAGLGIIQYLLDKSKKPGAERITDIGFNSNGFLTIETNARKFTYGNHPGEPKITRQYIENLIQRMSQQEGFNGTSFTQTSPLFNGSNDANYLRISANHEAVAPYGITMSIRVASPFLALTKKNFNGFAPMDQHLDTYNLFRILVQCHCNIMISAETGAGKTELQKLLVNFIPFQDRIIMIEDTAETHLPDLYPDKDIFSWLTTQSDTNKKGVTITDLVKQALRNNPKWLIVAETRGAEAYEMFQGVKSDHAIITTLHSISNEAVPSRFIGMAQMGYDLNEETTERDFLRYMHIGVHLTKKVINGHVFRYADEIAEFTPLSKAHPEGTNVLLKQHLRNDGIREYWTGAPTASLQEKLYNERDKTLICKPMTAEMRKQGTPKNIEWPIIPRDHMIRQKILNV